MSGVSRIADKTRDMIKNIHFKRHDLPERSFTAVGGVHSSAPRSLDITTKSTTRKLKVRILGETPIKREDVLVWFGIQKCATRVLCDLDYKASIVL